MKTLLQGSCVLLVVACLLTVPASVEAQLPPDFDPRRSELSREDLGVLLERYESVVASPAYSEDLKVAARRDAARVRERLEVGDFQPGDRVVLSVQGEPNIPDTVAVVSGPSITLPLFGSITLRGVLRSELQLHLTTELGRVIRDPVVEARALMRISVMGAVARPGVYFVPGQSLIDETLMRAGGPAPYAEMDELRIERASLALMAGQELQDAIRLGRTLDQLNLQAGDRIVVPGSPASGSSTLAWIGSIVGIVTAVAVLIGSGGS